MKKKLLILSVVLAMGMVACQKERVINNVDQSTPAKVLSGADADIQRPSPVSRLWKVGLFTVNMDDLTRNYDGYAFEFFSDNTILVRNEDIVIPGKWIVADNECYLEFTVDGIIRTQLPTDARDNTFFTELNGTWHFTGKYPTSGYSYPSWKQPPMMMEMSGYKMHKVLRLDKL